MEAAAARAAARRRRHPGLGWSRRLTTRSTTGPIGGVLRSQEMEAVLSRNWVARLAFCWKNHVDIEPIYYVYEKPWLFGRTSVGAKLVAMAHNEWCAAV